MNTLQTQIIKRLTQGPPPPSYGTPQSSRGYASSCQNIYYATYFDNPHSRDRVWNGHLYTRDLPGEGMPKSRAVKTLERLGLIETVQVEMEDQDGNKFYEPTSGKGKMVRLTDAGKDYAANL